MGLQVGWNALGMGGCRELCRERDPDVAFDSLSVNDHDSVLTWK